MTPFTTASAFETDRLAELAGRRHGCLQQLHVLSRRQLELIDQEDMTQLLGVLAAKQRLLGELQEVERGLDPFRGQNPAERRWRTPEARRRCADLIAQSEALFAEILQREKEGEEQMRRRRDQKAVRLQGARTATQARSAYAGDSARAGRLDVSSE
ncbi:MAG TPA: hypothetical protein VMV10_23505 [Pirellulales bacterium]|nr:hypothetical protein [Pirellulales bacterium]